MSGDTDMDIQRQLSAYKDAVNTALVSFFDEALGMLAFDLPSSGVSSYEKIREYTLRPGKRIRGSLASFAYDYAADTSFDEAGLQAAVALELAQSYLLIVDDVMDHSVLRRGLPTVHMLYRKDYPKESAHFADMQAVNAGLIAQHLMNLAIAHVEAPSATIGNAIRILHRNLAATGFGQIEDMYQDTHTGSSADEILRKYELKSGYYTFVCPLQVGLSLGGISDERVMQDIEQFGLAAGTAFQLTDDLVGIFGDSANTGKSSVDDIEEGKYTLLMQYALDHAVEKDRDYLKQVLGAPNATSETLREVQRILSDCGAKKYSEAQAEVYADRALDILHKNTYWNEDAKRTLEYVVRYATRRKQ